MREKLIELIIDSPGLEVLYATEEEFAKNADWLIANGVTIQKWIPVTERLPEKDKGVLCLLGDGDYWVAVWDHCDDGLWTDGEWWRAKNFVTHWMPLPEPPKGE